MSPTPPQQVTPNTSKGSPEEVLPLDWTRIKRRQNSDNMSADRDQCCDDDPSCRRRSYKQTSLKEEVGEDQVISGLAIFFFHEVGPSWFQGYITLDQSPSTGKSYGLLAVQEELDECLECADGGYRQIGLSILGYCGSKQIALPGVVWTGGDMMKLRSEKVRFEPDRFCSGMKALPYARKFFAMLLDKAVESGVDESDMGVVLGKLQLVLPSNDKNHQP